MEDVNDNKGYLLSHFELCRCKHNHNYSLKISHWFFLVSNESDLHIMDYLETINTKKSDIDRYQHHIISIYNINTKYQYQRNINFKILHIESEK